MQYNIFYNGRRKMCYFMDMENNGGLEIQKILKIQEIKEKNIWEDFLLGCGEKTFLQSWNWGEFQKMMGNKIWRLGVYANNDLMGAVLMTKVVAKRGTFLLIQHGPTIKFQNSNFKFQILEALLEEFKKNAEKERASFIRIAPLLERGEENKKLFQKLGFREAPMHANAYESTLKLDITPSEEKILMGFRKTTRYLVHQSLKNPALEIIKSDRIEDIKLYNKLNQEVADYQKFVPFSYDFVKNEFEVFSKPVCNASHNDAGGDNQALLFFGRYGSTGSPQGKKEIIASALIIFWQGTAFYHQAALSPKYHKIPISYLLLWEAIKEAKKRECSLFDFWGYVDPEKNFEHPWAGPTLFKMGFGGKIFEYVKTQDFVISKKYWITWLFEKIRKMRRGL